MEPCKGDMRLTIDAQSLDMGDVAQGDSIAINGVCLTVINFNHNIFDADVSNETLRLTSLKNIKQGDKVNLEKALLPTTRLGGHLVSGHVDGVGRIVNISKDARSTRYKVEIPEGLARYIAVKGSVCVDGVSLTINSVDNNSFEINIIPHTNEQTIFQTYSTGSEVNIEVDLIARYMERLLQCGSDKQNDISVDTLSKAGFIK